ncbi:MAG: ribbon-helix-helix protein, CopG family [Actinomycetota bacterium]|nr:ribbon-helix-helix protein, CopG family [Actinomycetota bacterium]
MQTYTMQRAQISVTSEERRAVEALAARTGLSISALIRAAAEDVHGAIASFDDRLAGAARERGFVVHGR